MMESDYRDKVFQQFEVTESEKEFIENVKASCNPQFNDRLNVAHGVLTNLYLAKQIEAASKSNDKSSSRMFWLTLVIGVFGAVQLVELILKLLGILK